MHYGDNPLRPRTHFWFGPMTMVDFLGNYNLWYQVSPTARGSAGGRARATSRRCMPASWASAPALTDIQNNHPNDLVSLIDVQHARDQSADDGGRFNRVRVGLSRDYSNMQESLWYPPATVGNSSATVRPYDSNNLEVPRAMGGTCYAMGLMLAYNQFSGNTSLRTTTRAQPAGDAGGNGRKGAQKIIIFETDGAPNTTATATLNNLGAVQQLLPGPLQQLELPAAANFPPASTAIATTPRR